MRQSKTLITVTLVVAMSAVNLAAQHSPFRQLLRHNLAQASSQPDSPVAIGLGSNPFRRTGRGCESARWRP